MGPLFTKCPKCETISGYTGIIQENAPGAEIWSDGFIMAPLRKQNVNFGKCQSCNAFFWLNENSISAPANTLGINMIDNSWNLADIGKKEIHFIKEAFRAGLAKEIDNEIQLRTILWQTINNIMRKFSSLGYFKQIKQKLFETIEYKEAQKLYSSFTSLKLENLIRLANLLKLDKSGKFSNLLFAEIYRELGDKSKALIFCHKAEKSYDSNTKRIKQLKKHLINKSESPYKV